MNVFSAIFLLLPIVALVAKELLKSKTSLWLIFLVWILVGWLLANLSVWRQFELLDELMRSSSNPSEELLDRWQSDGAARVFALYFGWAYAAIYFFFCMSLTEITRYIKRKIVNTGRK